MKYIAILFSILFSIVSLILSLFLYPLIASFLDSTPIPFVIIFRLLILLTILVVTLKLFQEKGVRIGIIFPYVVSVVLSIIFISVKFQGSCYNNGYAENGGDLFNSIGVEVISGAHYSSQYFRGTDKNGKDIIVEYFHYKDNSYAKDSDGEYRYIIEIKVYNEYYQFLWRADSYEYAKRTYDLTAPKEFIDGWKGIRIDGILGN